MKTVVLMFAVLATVGTLQAQNLLVDGSFSSGFTGWTATGDVQVVGSATNYVSSGNAADFNYQNEAVNGKLTQTFTTVSGKQYELTFEYGGYTTQPTQAVQKVEAELVGLSSSVLTNVTETAVGYSRPSDLASYSIFFTANSSSTTLEFIDASLGFRDSDGILTDVSVIAVPEPSTLAMSAVGGLFSVLALRRRK